MNIAAILALPSANVPRLPNEGVAKKAGDIDHDFNRVIRKYQRSTKTEGNSKFWMKRATHWKTTFKMCQLDYLEQQMAVSQIMLPTKYRITTCGDFIKIVKESKDYDSYLNRHLWSCYNNVENGEILKEDVDCNMWNDELNFTKKKTYPLYILPKRVQEDLEVPSLSQGLCPSFKIEKIHADYKIKLIRVSKDTYKWISLEAAHKSVDL